MKLKYLFELFFSRKILLSYSWKRYDRVVKYLLEKPSPTFRGAVSFLLNELVEAFHFLYPFHTMLHFTIPKSQKKITYKVLVRLTHIQFACDSLPTYFTKVKLIDTAWLYIYSLTFIYFIYRISTNRWNLWCFQHSSSNFHIASNLISKYIFMSSVTSLF